MPRKPTGRPRGRQLGSGELGLGTQDEHTRLTLRIPHDLYTRLEAFAAGRHFHRGSPKLAQCVRDAVEHYLTCPTKRQTSNVPGKGQYTTRQTSNGTEGHEDNIGQTLNVPAEALEVSVYDTVQTLNVPELETLEEEHNNRQTSNVPEASWQPVLAPVPADTTRAQRRALLLSVVPCEADTPSGITPADIRRATGISKIDATNDLDELRKHGHVVKVGPGRYARPGPAPVTKEQ